MQNLRLEIVCGSQIKNEATVKKQKISAFIKILINLSASTAMNSFCAILLLIIYEPTILARLGTKMAT